MDEFGWLADYLLEASNPFSGHFRGIGLARLDYKAHESWETFGKTWGFFLISVFVSFSVRDTTMFIVMGGKGGRRGDYLLLLPIRTKQRGQIHEMPMDFLKGLLFFFEMRSFFLVQDCIGMGDDGFGLNTLGCSK